MEQISAKITGRYGSVDFYPDDTIEMVRQLIALAVESHPDRIFLEVQAELPKNYYSSNPKRWTDLFFRLSHDGQKITQETLQVYLTQTRIGTNITSHEITKEDWEAHNDSILNIFSPDDDFTEWRILGVEESKSVILPIPPKEVPDLPSARIPIIKPQSLFETFHSYPIREIRATLLPDEASDLVKRIYYPFLRPDTGNTIESLRTSIENSQIQFRNLIQLDTPKHETAAIVKAKWYIQFNSTHFTAPRSRFEQMFYGLTVSKEIPYVGFFTAKKESLRHKFYVENPKQKIPYLSTDLLRGWLSTTMPQRRKPTLLLYRGKSRTSFDRIAITDTDITVDIRRDKNSKQTLEEMKSETLEWIQTFDAVIPFLIASDLERWELADLSLIASYPSEINEFDMRRFSCLQSIFGAQNDTFRLLRAEHTSEDISPRVLQAYQILSQEGAGYNPSYLADQLNISNVEATELFNTIVKMSEDFDFEKSLKAYPTLKFTSKEILVKFVTNPERILKYADILRFVLTSDSAAVEDVCPRRLEEVAPQVVVPQQAFDIEEEQEDLDLLAELGEIGLTTEERSQTEEQSQTKEQLQKPVRKLKVEQKTMATYGYFMNRLKEFDSNTFDQTIYPNKCDKGKQTIVLTPQDKERIGPKYNYEDVTETEKMELSDPDGTAICPPYWCMRDEIPLKENQLVTGDDGELHCPICDGKVRPASDNADTREFTVIKRETAYKYPKNMSTVVSSINKRKMPCCYIQPSPKTKVIDGEGKNESFVLKETSELLPPLRYAYLSSDLANQLKVKPNYTKTVVKGRFEAGETDVFKIGLGRPSKTLPVLFKNETKIKRPKEARENILKCSFFRTWRDTKEGDTQIDRLIASIDDAYQTGELTPLQELEYVTTFLQCEVILIDTKNNQVSCGFWSDVLGADRRTIAILDETSILGLVTRKKEGNKKYKTDFEVDLRRPPFTTTTWPHLINLHKQACSVGIPTLDDAIGELQRTGNAEYEVILDPFKRIQAVFVPKKIILPIFPSNTKPKEGVSVRDGYANITEEELPDGSFLRSVLKEAKHPGFRKVKDNQNLDGQIVEFELASGFRIPIRSEEPEEGPDYAAEVTDTIRNVGENVLVDGKPNKEDIKLAQTTAYSNEMFEFLLYSLSKDIRTEEYGNLRTSISNQSSTLYKDLDKWYKEQSYSDTTESPIEFINKVRTPCGQFTKKDSCNKSSLCGWHKNDCKIKVKSIIVSKEELLKRMVKVLRDNSKQRALVLDARLSPFFSTVLYLELPNELITTSF